MNINLRKLNFNFQDKPLLIGGKAMEHYNIRKAGSDIDFVVSKRDHAKLIKKYPNHIKDLFGDIGVIEFEFEIWNQICTFDYEFLKKDAVEEKDYLIIAIEKLLLLKSIAMHADDKYRKDTELIGNYIRNQAYKNYVKE